MRYRLYLMCGLALLTSAEVGASVLHGPGRFCGYSPIIDLVDGEQIETLEGGIHGGTFRWTGAFGTLEVDGIGWASRPKGTREAVPTASGQILFRQRRQEGENVVAIWNGRQGAAYFKSPRNVTRAQMKAIDRVILFQEGEDPGEGCKLRTMFSWDFDE